MAPRIRTFFIQFVSVTGFFYFVYIAYISNFCGPLYEPISQNREFENVLYSSSTVRPKKKGEILNNLYRILGSINNRKNNNNRRGLNENFRNKMEDKDVPFFVLAKNYTRHNLPRPRLGHRKSRIIQRISSREASAITDYLAKGIRTRKLYDSGFKVANAKLCPNHGNHLKIVILITSAPDHMEAREAIRQTWGHFQMRDDIAIGFILGRSFTINDTLIEDEYVLYGDVILANFYDSYTNLTLKSTSILEWVDSYCSRAEFVLKTDDDMFINIPKLLAFISKHREDRGKIFGRLAQKWRPIRRRLSKYYVSRKQFAPSLFPDFTTGPAYLMTSDVIHDLYIGSLATIYLTLEDVFTTGIVAEEMNVERVHVDEFFNYHLDVLGRNVSKTITIHMIKPFEQFDLWGMLDERTQY